MWVSVHSNLSEVIIAGEWRELSLLGIGAKIIKLGAKEPKIGSKRKLCFQTIMLGGNC